MFRKIRLWGGTGGVIHTPYVITHSAYPGESFINVDGEYPYAAELEQVKERIRSERTPSDQIKDPQVGRYSPVEVARFLNLARRWV